MAATTSMDFSVSVLEEVNTGSASSMDGHARYLRELRKGRIRAAEFERMATKKKIGQVGCLLVVWNGRALSQLAPHLTMSLLLSEKSI